MTDSGGFQVFSLAHGSVHDDLASGGNQEPQYHQPHRKQGGELKKARTGERKTPNNNNSKMKPKVTEEGVVFRSYRDGSKLLLTPESTVQAQKKLGADIIIPLDELPGYYTDRDRLETSVERTHRWEARSLQEHLRNLNGQAMYCVIHGGIDRELRTRSIDYLTSLPFDGYAIGGSLGNGRDELKDLLDFVMPQLDSSSDRKSKPRHLLGIADEVSVRNAVSLGLDTMDSCYPTRLARHGTLLVRGSDINGDNGDNNTVNEGGRQGGGKSPRAGEGAGTTIKIGSGRYRKQFGVKIDPGCDCSTCSRYDRSYLWHLFKAREPLALSLATAHNVHYMSRLMRDLREQIMRDEI
jgi:queuine tRNA-ribosyltransferase